MWYFQLTEAATCLKKMMDLSFITSFNFHYITLLKITKSELVTLIVFFAINNLSISNWKR